MTSLPVWVGRLIAAGQQAALPITMTPGAAFLFSEVPEHEAVISEEENNSRIQYFCAAPRCCTIFFLPLCCEVNSYPKYLQKAFWTCEASQGISVFCFQKQASPCRRSSEVTRRERNPVLSGRNFLSCSEGKGSLSVSLQHFILVCLLNFSSQD